MICNVRIRLGQGPFQDCNSAVSQHRDSTTYFHSASMLNRVSKGIIEAEAGLIRIFQSQTICVSSFILAISGKLTLRFDLFWQDEKKPISVCPLLLWHRAGREWSASEGNLQAVVFLLLIGAYIRSLIKRYRFLRAFIKYISHHIALF